MITIIATIVGGIHVLAAAALAGGAFFAKVVLPKATANLDPATAGRINEAAGKSFTMIVWVSIGLLLLTGLARSAAIGALNPAVLFDTTYGVVLITKILLFVVGILNAVLIMQQGMRLSDLGKSGADPQVMGAATKKMSNLQLLGLVDVVIIIVLAVALRIMGVPEI